MSGIEGLIARLAAARETDQDGVLRKALGYARERRWISDETFDRAISWVVAGAFLDAALTLVPEGWSVEELFIGGDKSASVRLLDDGDPERAFESVAVNTAPLAVCIAALKGRAV